MARRKKAASSDSSEPTETKAQFEVHVARRSVNTWWCDNCDTGNPVSTENPECAGCGGIADLG